jgi:hypothetical protein
VAGSYRYAAIHLQETRGEINFFRATLTNVVDVNSRFEQPAYKRAADALAAQPNVITHHYFAGPQKFCIGTPDPVGNVLIQLVRNAASYIVGLKAGKSIHLYLGHRLMQKE